MNASSYTTRILSTTLFLSCVPMVGAQDAAVQKTAQKKEAVAPTQPTVISAEELASRKASIPLIEARIKDREKQIKEIVQDMERLNARIEGRIDKIVESLKGMKDSQNSKVRVAKMKQDVMMGLGESIKSYNRRRAELEEMLRTGHPAIGDSAAQKGVHAFDTKIEKRMTQLVSLSESFTKHVDYEKYINDSDEVDRYGNVVHHDDLGWDWGWDNTRVSEKWKQNRRETVFTRKQSKAMTEALKSSIDDLERQNNTLRNKLKEAGTSPETQKFYKEDIARNEAALASRKKQLGALMDPQRASVETESVSRNAAHDTEMMIREIVSDIKRDGNDMTRHYNDLKGRLQTLERMKKNLEARKAWLEKYEATHQESPKE